MKRFLYTLLAIGLLAGVVGCSPEFDTPEYKESQYTGAATMTIKAFKEKFTNKAPVEIKENIVLRGIVNASDSCGNVYKKIYFQDLEGTTGLELVVDGSSLYKICNVGQEIFVECKGLYVGNYEGYTAIGTPFAKSNGDLTIGRMPLFLAKEHIFKQGRRDVSKVKIQTINSLSELTPDMVDRVITIKNIYFTGGGKDVFADKTSQYPTSREISDLKGIKSLVYTSAYATFSQKTLPKGMGSITCVATKYGSTWQLLIRDYNDVGTFDGTDVEPPKPPVFEGNATHTIAEFKSLYNDDIKQIAEDVVLRGVVTSSDQSGNIFKKIYIQDETGAIEININAKSLYQTYQPGQEVFVVCKGLYMGKYGGVHQIGDIYNGKIGQMTEIASKEHIFTKQGPGPLVTPTVTDIASLTPNMVDKLVTIKNLTFTNAGKNPYAGDKPTSEELKDAANNSIIIYTSNYASFKSTILPSGPVTITAIASMYNGKWQLVLSDIKDVVKEN